MKVADVMQTRVISVTLDATLADAVVTLAEAHVSGLPVIDRHDRLVGVLSSSDVMGALADEHGLARGRDYLNETTVREVMTPRPATVPGGLELREAAQQMHYLGVHRLFVESEGALAGVISQTDIVSAVATGRA
jgi:CBS domain-containing protein